VITVTTEAIRDAFVAAILGIVPTATPLQSIRWAYTPAERVNGRALLQPATRNFDLVFRNTVPNYQWVGGRGTAYQTTLAVATSYAGVEPETRDHIEAQDGVDLRRALRRLISTPNGLPGLCDVRVLGTANASGAEATYYVEHTFEVHYHQATA